MFYAASLGLLSLSGFSTRSFIGQLPSSYSSLHKLIASYFHIWLVVVQHDLLQLAQSFGVVQKVVMLRAKNQVCANSWEFEVAACHLVSSVGVINT